MIDDAKGNPLHAMEPPRLLPVRRSGALKGQIPGRLPPRGDGVAQTAGAARDRGFRLSEQLRMTPQLEEAIRLLTLSRAELVAEIQRELASNPILLDENVEPRPSSR